MIIPKGQSKMNNPEKLVKTCTSHTNKKYQSNDNLKIIQEDQYSKAPCFFLNYCENIVNMEIWKDITV